MSFSKRYRPALASKLGGQAIDGAGNSHLASGTHVRIAPDPDMGLPVRPFEVARVSLGQGSKWPGVRNDIEWRDFRGRPLTPPFEVTADKPVKGYLPRGNEASCCWLRVNHSGGVGPFIPTFPIKPSILAAARGSGSPRRPRRPRPSPLTPTIARRFNFRFLFGGLTVSAHAMTQMGPAEVAVRTRPPYEVAATPIEWIEIRGTGTVESVAWLETGELFREIQRRVSLPASSSDKVALWRRMPLPVRNSVRYEEAPNNVFDVAKGRAAEAAPKKFGLHDNPDVSGPANSPDATPADELKRLGDVIEPQAPDKGLKEHLQDLVDTDKPEEVVQQIPISESGGGSFDFSVLDGVLQSLADPGVAHWMGFAAVDNDPPTDVGGELIAYAVGGSWLLPDLIDGGERVSDLGTVLCAVRSHPGNRPRPPEIDDTDDRGFLPMPPPSARRAIEVSLTKLTLGVGLALARRLSGAISGLNKRATSGRAIPFWPRVPDSAVSPAESTITDRAAPADAFQYRASQHDWFGRWSEWSERSVPAAERPGPPVPILHATYQLPTDLAALGPLSGTISVTIPVPPVSTLSPGAHLLDHIELLVDGAATDIPLANAVATELTADISGPAIARAGQATVTLVAHWHDQAGNRSGPSQARTLTLNDPRPAPGVTFSPGLRYTSRPDATGWARYRLQWLNSPGQAFYRVFYTNELRLREALEQIFAGGGADATRAGQALQAIDSATNIAERAQAYEVVSDLFDREFFEQLTTDVLDSPSGTSLVSFDHAVSAALKVLSFYKVISVTQAQVESAFTESTLLPVGVPNTLRPPRPSLVIRPDIADDGRFVAELQIAVALSNIDATEFRLRRAIGGASDLESMPVVATGPLLPTPEGRREAVLTDDGSSPFNRSLKPWIPFQWRVEARGPAEVGDGPAAEWM
jgi:hypothetical protein